MLAACWSPEPPFLAIAIAIAPLRRERSRWQLRCGLHGRPFTFLKFRSMRVDAEALKKHLAPYNEMDGPAFKMTNDPRVTPLGRFLRRTSLDELPQLWNIIRGDMSIVGPRPAVLEEVRQYEPWQRRRLSMKPGLTCLWQVTQRADVRGSGCLDLISTTGRCGSTQNRSKRSPPCFGRRRWRARASPADGRGCRRSAAFLDRGARPRSASRFFMVALVVRLLAAGQADRHLHLAALKYFQLR